MFCIASIKKYVYIYNLLHSWTHPLRIQTLFSLDVQSLMALFWRETSRAKRFAPENSSPPCEPAGSDTRLVEPRISPYAFKCAVLKNLELPQNKAKYLPYQI